MIIAVLLLSGLAVMSVVCEAPTAGLALGAAAFWCLTRLAG
jgi:hypothetical protein